MEGDGPSSRVIGSGRLANIQTDIFSTQNPKKLEYVTKLSRLAILPGYRGRGISKKLLQAGEYFVLNQNQQWPIKFVMTSIYDKRRIYENLGYSILFPDQAPFYHEGVLIVPMGKTVYKKSML